MSGDEIGTAYRNTASEAKVSPYTIATRPPDANAANSFCFGALLSESPTGAGIITTAAGATASFNIQPVDAAGLYLPELADGNILKVAVTDGSLTGQGGDEPYFVADRTTASIKVFFVAYKTGALQLTVSVITTVDGVPVVVPIGYPPDGIFTVDVKPGAAVANTSYTRDDPAYPLSSYATAGQQHQYQAGGVLATSS